MFQRTKKQLWVMVWLMCFGLIMGCGGGGDSNDNNNNTPALVNITGVWQVEEVVNGNCSGSNYPYTRITIYTATQQGNTVTMRDDLEGREMQGTVNGYTVTINGTFADADGMTSIRFTGLCSENGQSFNGTGQWTYEESGYSCNGTNAITGTKISDSQVDVTGDWTGTYESDEYPISGTFAATIVDTDGDLTGTFSAPLIDMTDVELVGTVNGSVITFGDISHQIIFSGVITETGSAASGSYVYYDMGDEGTWSANRF